MIPARLTAQRLSGPPARSAEAVVQRLLAVQAQDARGVRLAVRSRSVGLLATDVDAAFTERRSLLIAWLNRGTLHLVGADDYWWLHPLTTPQLATGNRRRLQQEGVSEAQCERGVGIVVKAVRSRGACTRAELRTLLVDGGIPTAGQAFVHVLFAASIRGDIVRGPMRGSEHAFVSAADWLGGAPEPIERSDALARLARRYLEGHGPAEPRDLANWAGVTLGHARAAFAAIAAHVVERADGLVDLAVRDAPARVPPPRLLGAFDPLLHGWVSREAFVGSHQEIVTSNGLFRASVLVGGRVVGTWGLSGTTLTVTLLEKVKAADVEALRRDGADVFRFLGLPKESDVVVRSSSVPSSR